MIFALVFLKFFWDLFYFPFRPFMLNALNLMSMIFLFSDSVFGLMLNIPGNIKIKVFFNTKISESQFSHENYVSLLISKRP